MIKKIDETEIRKHLEKELERLLTNLNNQQGQKPGSNPDRDDLAHTYIRQERRLALQDVEETQVTQIKEALKRIDDGVYGTCANCGTEIEPERLEIIPYATLCVTCQQAQTKFKGV